MATEEQFEGCAQEMKAFVRGGLPGMQVLNKVYRQILKHYDATDDEPRALFFAGLYFDQEEQLLKKIC